MTAKALHKPNRQSSNNGLTNNAIRLVKKLSWLLPTTDLAERASRDFGRSIEASLNGIVKDTGVLRLKLRKRDAAIVMSIDHYEEMIRMKTLYSELLDHVKELEIESASDDFESLYRSITSEESLHAADTLFSATPEQLRKTFQPGRTEST